jgi:hypothetical protein
MAEIIDAERETDDNAKVARKRKRKPKKTTAESDNDDNPFVESSSDSESTSQSDGVEIANEEVSSFLLTYFMHFIKYFPACR